MDNELKLYQTLHAFLNTKEQVEGIIKSLKFLISHFDNSRESLESFKQFIKSLTIINESLKNLITCELYEIDHIELGISI